MTETVQAGSEFKPQNKIGYIASAILQATAAIQLFSIIPLLVGAMVDRLGFETGESGYIISAEIAGLAVANGFGFFWVNRLSWRNMSRFLLGALVLADLACIMITSYEALMAVRVLCGLIEGSILALTYAMLARTSRPDRNFGLFFSVSLTFGGTNILIAGQLLDMFSMPGLFIDLAVLCLLAMTMTRYIPIASGGALVRDQGKAIRGLLFGAIIIILIANLIYFAGQNGVWSYLERLANQRGIEAETIRFGLFLSLIAGVAGALSAAVQDNHFGRVAPLSLALGLALGSIAILSQPFTAISFILGACIFNFANNYGHPYLLGYLAQIDPNGRYVVASGGMQTGGMAIGPAIAGSIIVGTDVSNVLWLGATAFIISIILFIPIMLLIRGNRNNLAVGVSTSGATHSLN